MLTKADDYPVHQTPEPVACAGTHVNLYDRYYFNGYTRDGDHFFSAALGVYPYRDIMDAAFCVIQDNLQHNLHASRVFKMERMDTRAGPISVEVLEPLKCLRVRIEENEHGISGELTFRGRARTVEEPRFVYRVGPRTLFDYTRMAQSGTYSGWLDVKGERIGLSHDRFFGTRDRSWGIRPIGNLFAEPMGSPPPPQYYWLWAPLHFEDCVTFFGTNEYSDGTPWHRCAMIAQEGEGEAEVVERAEAALVFRSGTRHATRAVLHFHHHQGRHTRILLEPRFQFYMSGLGYNHPEWGHGVYKGEDATGYDVFRLDDIDETIPQFQHVQAFVTATMADAGGTERSGFGVLEQTIIGPHQPSGFRDLLDMAP